MNRAIVSYLLAAICASPTGQAQNNTSGSRLLLKNYTTDDGLPDTRIAPIIQDVRGYLWFGTQAGLTRYDGREFQTFGGAKDVPGIFGRAICEDHRGAIWFAYTGFARGGLLRYFNGTVTEFPSVIDSLGGEAGSVVEDVDGHIWVGSSGGLIRLHLDDSAAVSFRIEKFPNINASALFVDAEHRVWVGTFAGELYVYEKGTFVHRASGLSPSIRPYAMYQTRNKELWVGGIFGAACLHNGEIQRFDTSHGLPARGVWCFAEDNYGNFWVGTTNGLYRAQRSSALIHFRKDPSFGDALVYDVCLDNEGNLWLASDPGLRKMLAADLVIHFPHEERLATAGFGPIAQQPDGTLLFGSRNSGVFALKGTTLIPGVRFTPSTSFTVLSIFPEAYGRTWYGMKSQAPMLQVGQTTRVLNPKSSDIAISVFSITKTPAGLVLFGTNHGVKYYANDDSILTLSHPLLDSLIVFDFLPEGRDILWVATANGLVRLTFDGTRISKLERIGLRGVIVYALVRDHGGRVWCGTDGAGLVLIDAQKFTFYTRDDGLAGNRVLALARDSLGLLWIGTSSGLSQFDGTSFRSFTHNEGFGEIGLHGLLTDRNGMLWVSSFPGISKLRPMRFFKSIRPPPVYIADMQVDTLHFTTTRHIELDPNPAAITFRYMGLSFTDEAHVRYRYKLDGFDRDWSPPVTYREVRYTHLGSGSYTFQVMARSADGVWSDRAAALPFTILPPVWARWWFISCAVLILALTIYGVYRYRLAKAVELERTRSRIAMDLHDDIGASLTRISMMTEVARRMEPANDLQDYLGRIGETARDLIDSLGDIVWSVNPRYDTLQDVIRRIVHFGEEMCEAQGIAFETVIVPELEKLTLSLERRRELYLIFKEAIANAVRHSRADRLVFSSRTTDDGIIMAVTDNGRSFLPNVARTGHGMQSMKERAERLGATLYLHSQSGEGTRVELLLKTD